MKISLKLFIVFVLSFVQYNLAGNPSVAFHFNHLTNNDGLSSSRVNCTLEDSDGFIWFGTEDGLNLYDGVSFRIFKNIPGDTTSLCNNAVYCLTNDPQSGNLWIGTRMGICVFDKMNFRFQPIFSHSGIEKEIAEHMIVDLKFDQYQQLWIATSNGLFSYNINTKSTQRFVHDGNNENSLISNYVNHIFIDNDKRLLISTRLGIDFFDVEKAEFTHLFPSDSLQNVMCIFKDSFGRYWIGTDNMGVYLASYNGEYHLSKFKIKNDEKLHSSRIHSILEDNGKNVLLMARDKGLFYFNRETNSISFIEPDIYDSQSLSSKALISAYKSSSGIIWLGTFNRGINYLDYSRKPFQHYKNNYKGSGLFNNNVRSFFQDSEGNIWVGTKEGGGLSLFNSELGTFQNFKFETGNKNSFSNDYILVINELNSDELLLGTLGAGVDVFNKRTHKITNLKVNDVVADNKVYGIYKDSLGIL